MEVSGINDIIMKKFVPGKVMGDNSMFILMDSGFYKVSYKNTLRQMSIDTLDKLKSTLRTSLRDTVLNGHISKLHDSGQQDMFN